MSIATYGAGSTTSPTSNGGTFPGATNGGGGFGAQLSVIASQVDALTPGQFAADYGISSTEQPTYFSNGKYTMAAYSLAYYYSLTQPERQAIQDQMVTTGLLSASAATGARGGAALTAFKDLVGATSAQGTDAFDWLNQNATPQAQLQSQISANLTAAQTQLEKPTVITQENPSTLQAAITNAFDQTLGYAPDPAQVDAFIKSIQGQDAAYANAPRAAAQQEINQAKSETAALDALGPDSVDQVIKAYQDAVNGTGLQGVGTQQGPANAAAGAIAPAGVEAHTNVPTGQQPFMGPTKMEDRGFLSSVGYEVAHNTWSAPQVAVPTGGMEPTHAGPRTAPILGYGHATATPTYGGLYALSAADWKAAQADYAPAKKYPTPGQAPEAIQQAAFTQLLIKTYEAHNNSWAAAISAIASGTPFGEAKGTNLTAFGQQVASQVNAQIASLQNQVNNSPVTVKVTAPDAAAEANLAAKQADPTGYYAANVASWGSVLNQMLQGSPTMFDQSTSDTFTGPVGNEAGSVTNAPAGVS